MILTILRFFGGVFSAIWTFVTEAATAALAWCKLHPKSALVILALAVSNVITGWYFYGVGVDKTTASFKTIIADKDQQITKYKADIKERDEKILKVEADSKTAAEEAAKAIVSRKAELVKAKNEFERKLAEEKKKRSVGTGSITVTNPVTNHPIEVTVEKDEVICGRYHDAFLDSINSMVGIINTTGILAPKLEKGMTPVRSTPSEKTGVSEVVNTSNNAGNSPNSTTNPSQ